MLEHQRGLETGSLAAGSNLQAAFILGILTAYVEVRWDIRVVQGCLSVLPRPARYLRDRPSSSLSRSCPILLDQVNVVFSRLQPSPQMVPYISLALLHADRLIESADVVHLVHINERTPG